MIDATRHHSIFDPSKWTQRVDVIGVGATGSKIALSLAKLGVRNLHVWDGDTVEAHNLANQAYNLSDVGSRKVEATHFHIAQATRSPSRTHGYWQDTDARTLGEVVFCMVDSMAVRKAVYEGVKRSARVKLVVDSRMGADHAQLLTYSPQDPDSLRAYEGTLFSDDDAHVEVSACGTAITVGPTGDIISGYAVWHFIKHAAGQPVEREIVFGARDPSLAVL